MDPNSRTFLTKRQALTRVVIVFAPLLAATVCLIMANASLWWLIPTVVLFLVFVAALIWTLRSVG